MKKSDYNKVDFADLSFHDYKIYALGFDWEKFEFLLDIDVIFKWIDRINYFEFEVAPCTVVFSNVWDINIDISTSMSLTIDEIKRTNPQTPRNIEFLSSSPSIEYDWTINLLEGEISFKAINMYLYQRKESIISKDQIYDKIGEKDSL